MLAALALQPCFHLSSLLLGGRGALCGVEPEVGQALADGHLPFFSCLSLPTNVLGSALNGA